MTDSPESQSDGVKYREALLRETREELQRADFKASILLAATGIAYSALLTAAAAGSWTPSVLHKNSARLILWSSIILGALGIALLGAAVRPRLRSNNKNPELLHHFGDVHSFWPTSRPRRTRAARTEAARSTFAAALDSAATASNYSRRLDDQIWFLGHIAQQKYRYISLSLSLMGGAVVIAFLGALVEVL